MAATVEPLRRMVPGTNTSNSDWTWVDALHMAMPTFVRVASYLNDSADPKVLGLLPTGDTRRPEYTYNPQELSRSLLTRQRADRFWNVNLADPLQHPGPETSGTALFAFGLAYAIGSV